MVIWLCYYLQYTHVIDTFKNSHSFKNKFYRDIDMVIIVQHHR